MQKQLFTGILIAVFLTIGYLLGNQASEDATAMVKTVPRQEKPPVTALLPSESDKPQPPVRVEPRSRYVLDVVLHSVEEIEQLLDKAEQLASKPRSANEPASIAMVLHGPEIDIFSIRNYEKYQSVVDRAAKLDAYNIIDVKMCMTAMRSRGIRNEDVPGFIELVPYGPEEIRRLQEKGFVKL